MKDFIILTDTRSIRSFLVNVNAIKYLEPRDNCTFVCFSSHRRHSYGILVREDIHDIKIRIFQAQ